MRGCMRRGRTEELLCGDEQMCDGLFYLRELLLGLHFICGQWLVFGVGRGERERGRAHVAARTFLGARREDP